MENEYYTEIKEYFSSIQNIEYGILSEYGITNIIDELLPNRRIVSYCESEYVNSRFLDKKFYFDQYDFVVLRFDKDSLIRVEYNRLNDVQTMYFIHREEGKLSFASIKDGRIIDVSYNIYGQLHRENDLPSYLSFTKDYKVDKVYYHLMGEDVTEETLIRKKRKNILNKLK